MQVPPVSVSGFIQAKVCLTLGFTAEDSFYVISSNSDIPQASSSTSAAFLPSRSRTTTPKPSNSSSRHTPVSLSQSKTVEELSCENATLKEALNNLSLQYEQAVSSQNKERESLKQSILTLRTDIRKESDRVLRVPSQSFHQESIDEGPDGEESESKPDLEREVARLKTELAAAKASATKCMFLPCYTRQSQVTKLSF